MKTEKLPPASLRVMQSYTGQPKRFHATAEVVLNGNDIIFIHIHEKYGKTIRLSMTGAEALALTSDIENRVQEGRAAIARIRKNAGGAV